MTRNDIDIRNHPLRNKIDTKIKYTTAFGQLNAVIESGLDVEKYLRGGYEPWLLEQIMAYNHIKNLVKTHENDAVQIASERKHKTPKGRKYRNRR